MPWSVSDELTLDDQILKMIGPIPPCAFEFRVSNITLLFFDDKCEKLSNSIEKLKYVSSVLRATTATKRKLATSIMLSSSQTIRLETDVSGKFSKAAHLTTRQFSPSKVQL